MTKPQQVSEHLRGFLPSNAYGVRGMATKNITAGAIAAFAYNPQGASRQVL
jgi:hypothetical protein